MNIDKNVSYANKLKTLVSRFKLPKGYSISFPKSHTFTDGAKAMPFGNSPLIAINYNNERIGLSKIAFQKGKMSLMFVQGVNKKVKNHSKWFEYLLDPIIFSGIAFYGSSEKLKNNFYFTEYVSSKKNYENYKNMYEHEKKEFSKRKKDFSKKAYEFHKKDLEKMLNVLRKHYYKYTFYAKIKDRYFTKNGDSLNINKKRIKEMEKVYFDFLKAKNKGTIIKKKNKKPFYRPFKRLRKH